MVRGAGDRDHGARNALPLASLHPGQLSQLEREVVGERRVFQVRCEAILIDLRRGRAAPGRPQRLPLPTSSDAIYGSARRAGSRLRRGPGLRRIFRAEALSQVRRFISPIACEVTQGCRAIARRAVAQDYHSRMKPDHPVAFKPETAADAGSVRCARGIEYLFANGGTDFAPVVEAYAKGQKLGWRLPQIVIVPHENMGVAMAHGYAMVTGRPQAMMVHMGVGTANSLNGPTPRARTCRSSLPLAARRSPSRWCRPRATTTSIGRRSTSTGRNAAGVREVGLRAAPRRAGRNRARPRARHREERAAGPGVRHVAPGSPRIL